MLTRSTVTRVHGKGRVVGVSIRDLESGEEKYLPCDTLIVSVGLIPERELISGFDSIPEWLSLCGNCESVHEIVDSVTVQAEAAGKSII